MSSGDDEESDGSSGSGSSSDVDMTSEEAGESEWSGSSKDSKAEDLSSSGDESGESCISIYFQNGKPGLEESLMVELLASLINESMFDILRTK